MREKSIRLMAIIVRRLDKEIEVLRQEGIPVGKLMQARDLILDICNHPPKKRCANGDHSSGWYMGLRCTRCGDVD